MGEVNTVKRSKWKELKGEFRKIIWPDKKSLIKQTTVVIAVSLIMGVIVAVLDFVFQYGYALLPLK